MKSTTIKNKIEGMTLIETAVALALITIFLFLIFPFLRLTNKLEEKFYIQERIERNSARIIESIEKNIEASSFGIDEYTGRDALTNGKGIFVLPLGKPPSLDKNFFNNISDEGNTLLLEIPYVQNETIHSKYFIYRFYNKELSISQCTLLQGTLYFDTEDTLLTNAIGNFKKDDYGIRINIVIEIIAGTHIYRKELKGYALTGQKYE